MDRAWTTGGIHPLGSERPLPILSDRYRLERVLGSGGMALVYLAHDTKHQRQVAVKVMKPEVVRSIGPDRFLREIEIAARLSHPHIVPLYDSGAAGEVTFQLTSAQQVG